MRWSFLCVTLASFHAVAVVAPAELAESTVPFAESFADNLYQEELLRERLFSDSLGSGAREEGLRTSRYKSRPPSQSRFLSLETFGPTPGEPLRQEQPHVQMLAGYRRLTSEDWCAAKSASGNHTLPGGAPTCFITTQVAVVSHTQLQLQTSSRVGDASPPAVISGGSATRLFLIDGGTLTLSNLVLEEGSAVAGGAVFVMNAGLLRVAGKAPSTVIIRKSLALNMNSGIAGAVLLHGSGSTLVATGTGVNLLIEHNVALTGGGLVVSSGAIMVVENGAILAVKRNTAMLDDGKPNMIPRFLQAEPIPNSEGEVSDHPLRCTTLTHRSSFEGQEWFYLDDEGEELGPFSIREIERFYAEGSVDKETHVWTEEYENWQKVGECFAINEVIDGINRAAAESVVSGAAVTLNDTQAADTRVESKRRALKLAIRTSIVAILYLIWPGLCSEVFKMFACRSFCADEGNNEGTLRLLADLDVICFDGEHLTYSLVLGLPMLFLYVVGFPSFTLVSIWRLRRRAKRRQVRVSSVKGHITWGVFYSAFKRDAWWWEGVVAVQKISIAMIGIFGSNMVQMQVPLTLLLVLFVILLTSSVQPFSKAIIYRLEMMSLAALVVTLWAALVFNTYPRCEVNGRSTLLWCSFLSVVVGIGDVSVALVIFISFLRLKNAAWCLDAYFKGARKRFRQLSLAVTGSITRRQHQPNEIVNSFHESQEEDRQRRIRKATVENTAPDNELVRNPLSAHQGIEMVNM
eukprot:g1841.t1